jgi:predicted GIY-YIG superfamily endonuclease
MAHLNAFEKKLDQLFFDRTYEMRVNVGLKKIGARPHMTQKKINNAIETLQNLASNILARGLAKKEFEQNAVKGKKRRRKIVGRGWQRQKELYERWFKKEFINQDQLVYVLWNNKKCLYVGRTGNGGSRPSSHFSSKKFPRITRVDIYPTKSKAYTPKLECLAIHYLQPITNKNKAATKKWTRKCPLCAIHKKIEAELRKIFKLK